MTRSLPLAELGKHSIDLQKLLDDDYLLSWGHAPSWLAPRMSWLRGNISSRYWHSPRHWLLVRDISYVRKRKSGGRLFEGKGILAMPLWIQDDRTIQPKEHWAVWRGNIPRLVDGTRRNTLLARNMNGARLAPLRDVCVLSEEPPDNMRLYLDYYDKVRTYDSRISSQARRLPENQS